MLLILLLLIPLIGIFFLAGEMDGFFIELLVYLLTLIKSLAMLAHDLDWNYDYMYSEDFFSSSSLDEEYDMFWNDAFDFLSDNGVHFIDERIVFIDGVASPADAVIRDNTIANGYDPAISHQPYGRNLASKLERERNGSSQLPQNLVPADARFINTMCSHCWANYDANKHYKNSITMRNFLKNLP